MTEKKLRFIIKSAEPVELWNRFLPGGQRVLNSTEWRGKEPLTCAVTHISGYPKRSDDPSPFTFNVEVTYRPPGVTYFVGNTKYDGWKALRLKVANDGTLLDKEGKPLREGEQPYYDSFDLLRTVDFNQIDFGQFAGEEEIPPIEHLDYEGVMRQIDAVTKRTGKFWASINSQFRPGKGARKRGRGPKRHFVLDFYFVEGGDRFRGS